MSSWNVLFWFQCSCCYWVPPQLFCKKSQITNEKKKKEVKNNNIWLKIREVKILNQHFFHGATSVKLSAQNFLWIMTIQSLHKQNRTLHITSKASFVLVEYSIYVKHKKKHTEYKKLWITLSCFCIKNVIKYMYMQSINKNNSYSFIRTTISTSYVVNISKKTKSKIQLIYMMYIEVY